MSGDRINQANKNVATPTKVFETLNTKWSKIDTLKGGTEAMRAARTKFLPKEDAERETAYDSRIERSVLFGALKDTITRTINRPLSKQVILKEEELLPEPLDMIKDDVDRDGTNLTDFAKEVFEDGVSYGIMHCLIDYPKTTGKITLARQRNEKLRPRFVRYSPRNVIGWKSDVDNFGKTHLTQLRLREYFEREVDDYDTIEDFRIRVFNYDLETGTVSWVLFVRSLEDATTNSSTNWLEQDGGIYDRWQWLGIPFITAYLKKEGYMVAIPPFDDLSDMNIAHWQSMSDQRNILKYSRFAVLFGKGLDSDKVQSGLVLGANQSILTRNENADLKYVEHNGTAIGAGENDLERLEERMEILGMQPFVRRAGNQTATGKAIDEGKQQTEIQAWVRTLESFMYLCYKYSAIWEGKELPQDFTIDVFSDFGLASKAIEECEVLTKAVLSGKISNETYLKEIRKRGILSEDVNIEDELDKLSTEAPDFNMSESIVPIKDEDDEEDDIKDIKEVKAK